MASDSIRKEYARASLREEDVAPDPIHQFAAWFREAEEAAVPEPYAMTLATADGLGRPSARVVLMRGCDDRGFAFFTNYESRKGRELDANPFAALVFFWHELERQVRVEGRVERTSEAESDAYFRGRPAGARIGAWASRQSETVPSREALEDQMRQFQRRFPGEDIPRPPHWGGYRVVPDVVEFWQGRPNRLHDRLRYRRGEGGGWLIERLSP
jgi:pyridoxamine 5'-phosphate oxidase